MYEELLSERRKTRRGREKEEYESINDRNREKRGREGVAQSRLIAPNTSLGLVTANTSDQVHGSS